MPRGPTVAVAEFLKFGIVSNQASTAASDLSDVVSFRLEVVGDAKQQMDRPAGTTQPATGLEQVRYKPAIEGSLANFPDF